MTVIKQRLKFATDPDKLWFKDEGGRDKCIELSVNLVDHAGRPVQGRDVPLKVTLLYESGIAVVDQGILKAATDCTKAVGQSGSAVLRLRIEDVSKNHQNQAFVIKVEPDTGYSPLDFDISSDTRSARPQPQT